MSLERALTAAISATLERRMAFVGGPRQVGTTTLALSLVAPDATERHPAYLNWDDPRVPARLRRGELQPASP